MAKPARAQAATALTLSAFALREHEIYYYSRRSRNLARVAGAGLCVYAKGTSRWEQCIS